MRAAFSISRWPARRRPSWLASGSPPCSSTWTTTPCVDPEAMAAVERIEGWRSLGDNIIETIINKGEKIKELKKRAKDGDLTAKQKQQLTEEEKEYKSKRKLVQE